MTDNNTRVLSPGEAVAIGTVVDNVNRRKKIRYLSPLDELTIIEGEARGIIKGPNNFGFLGWGTDVRDGWVWVTTKTGMETSVSVAHLVKMIDEGGCMFED